MAKSITNPHYESLPLRLRQFRMHLGLSQAAFAELLGFDQTAISTMETGKQDITLKTIYRLMNADCNPIWLLSGVGPWQLSKVTHPDASVEVRKLPGATEYVVRVQKSTGVSQGE